MQTLLHGNQIGRELAHCMDERRNVRDPCRFHGRSGYEQHLHGFGDLLRGIASQSVRWHPKEERVSWQEMVGGSSGGGSGGGGGGVVRF